MLTEICGYLNNYFDIKRYTGTIKVDSGVVYHNNKEISMENGQYFALFRKNFVLGVYQFGIDTLDDKEFKGSVWLMDLPQAFLDIVAEIEAWQEKYGGTDSAAMSPFNAESFGGYSYTKGYSGGGGSIVWQNVFKTRLAQYKKVSLT